MRLASLPPSYLVQRIQFPLLLSLILAFSLAACSKKPAVIEVGKRRLTEDQLNKRMRQIQLLQPSYSRVEAAAGLIEGWVSDAVLQEMKKPVTADELEAERTQVASNEKIARLYKEVAKIYGSDQDSFVEVGLLPDLSLRRLHSIYAEQNAGNQGAREFATEFLANAQADPSHFSTASTLDAKVTTLFMGVDGIVKDATGSPIQILAQTADADKAAASRLLAIARTNQAGQVMGIVSRTTRGFMVLKKLEEAPEGVKFDAAFFEKIPFSRWLADHAKSVKVCILDETLRFQYQSATHNNLLHCE